MSGSGWAVCQGRRTPTWLWVKGTHGEFSAEPGGGTRLWISILGPLTPAWLPLRSSSNSHRGAGGPDLSPCPSCGLALPLLCGVPSAPARPVLLIMLLPLSLPFPISAHSNPSSPASCKTRHACCSQKPNYKWPLLVPWLAPCLVLPLQPD